MSENINKPLKDWLNDANQNSSKLSDINRSLAFAGIAIIWIFRNTESSIHILPETLICPLIFIICSLSFDYIQYLWKAIFLHSFYRRIEKKYNKKQISDREIEDVQVSDWCPNIGWLLFFLKISTLIVGYVLLFKFLFTKI